MANVKEDWCGRRRTTVESSNATAANFDEEVFDDQFTLDITRNPHPNLIFGPFPDHMPDLTSLSTPDRLRSGRLNGIKHWQVDYTGGCPVAH